MKPTKVKLVTDPRPETRTNQDMGCASTLVNLLSIAEIAVILIRSAAVRYRGRVPKASELPIDY